MVNEKKVRLMTQLALDEKRFYKDELDESGYFRSDYLRPNTLTDHGTGCHVLC